MKLKHLIITSCFLASVGAYGQASQEVQELVCDAERTNLTQQYESETQNQYSDQYELMRRYGEMEGYYGAYAPLTPSQLEEMKATISENDRRLAEAYTSFKENFAQTVQNLNSQYVEKLKSLIQKKSELERMKREDRRRNVDWEALEASLIGSKRELYLEFSERMALFGPMGLSTEMDEREEHTIRFGEGQATKLDSEYISENAASLSGAEIFWEEYPEIHNYEGKLVFNYGLGTGHHGGLENIFSIKVDLDDKDELVFELEPGGYLWRVLGGPAYYDSLSKYISENLSEGCRDKKDGKNSNISDVARFSPAKDENLFMKIIKAPVRGVRAIFN